MILFLSLFFGLAFGSFANVCIFRLPEDGSLRHPNSRCPSCQHPIRVIDNIPLLSFAVLRGHCRFCAHPISWQYPLVEAVMASLFTMNAWFHAGSLSQMILLDVLSFYGLTISVIDYRHRIIPDELSLSLLVLGWAFSWANPFLGASMLMRVSQSVLSSLVGGGMMLLLAWSGEKIFKKEALGGGDIKLVAAFGAVLGWQGLWGSLLIGSLLGGVCGIALLMLNRKKRGDTLPFGPFLCIGIFLTASFSSRIISLIFP